MRANSPGFALLPLCLIWASGCSTTFTTLNIDQRTVRVQVTSETPGAVVLLDGKTVGQTPAEVEVRFQQKAERINSGKYKAGWAVLGAGLAQVAVAVAMTAGGVAIAEKGGSEDDDGKVAGGQILAVFGVGLGLAGLASLGIGGIAVATSEASRERTVVQPATTVLEVRLPGGKRRSRRFAMSPAWPGPRLAEVGRMHVFDRRMTVRDCKIQLTPGTGVEVTVAAPGDRTASPGVAALDLPCQVRRLNPLVGLYSPTGRPLFSARFALRLGLEGPWRQGKLTLPLMLKSSGRQVRRELVLEATRAWKGPQIKALVGMDGAKITVQYGLEMPPADAASTEPPPGVPASPQK